MKVTQAIEKGCFISWIESHLLNENSKIGNLTFAKFRSDIWDFLCFLPKNLLYKLSSRIGLKRDKNIGNISLKIYELLGLTYCYSDDYLTLMF